MTDETERQTFVDQVISDVELSGLAHAIVGTDEGGLTFEQKKRLSIAVELAASPSILFLDEVRFGYRLYRLESLANLVWFPR